MGQGWPLDEGGYILGQGSLLYFMDSRLKLVCWLKLTETVVCNHSLFVNDCVLFLFTVCLHSIPTLLESGLCTKGQFPMSFGVILHIPVSATQSDHVFFRQWSWPAPAPSFLMNTTPCLSVSQNLFSTRERTWVSGMRVDCVLGSFSKFFTYSDFILFSLSLHFAYGARYVYIDMYNIIYHTVKLSLNYRPDNAKCVLLALNDIITNQ